MKKVKLEVLKGNEVLALPILSDTGAVLIHADMKLTPELIERIKSMNIEELYIRDSSDEEKKEEEKTKENRVYRVEETAETSREIVQNVLEKHIYKHNDELKKIGQEAVRIMDSVLQEPEVITNITEIRNVSTDMYTHCINVCSLSTIMALRLKMSERQVKNVSIGAILHDIGLRYTNVQYINRSEEDMNPKEGLEYKKHTIFGYSSLQDETWIPDIAKEIILLHHERLDGKGYPFRHPAEKIKTEVKLVSVCDAFDSLISGIGNQKMKIYEAFEYIKVHSGTMYDPTIAAKLLESVAAYPVGVNVIMSNGDKGIVIRQNKDVSDRPVVMLTEHADGTPYPENTECNLMKQLTQFIVDTE